MSLALYRAPGIKLLPPRMMQRIPQIATYGTSYTSREVRPGTDKHNENVSGILGLRRVIVKIIVKSWPDRVYTRHREYFNSMGNRRWILLWFGEMGKEKE